MKEKLNKIEKTIQKKKIEGHSVKIFLKSTKRKNIEQLVSTKLNEPIRSNLLISIVLLIEELILNLTEKDFEYYEPFLLDIRKVFERQNASEELNIQPLIKYLDERTYGTVFIYHSKKIKKINGKNLTDINYDLIPTIPLILLGYLFEGLSRKRYYKTLKKIMICKSKECNCMYANYRKNTCTKNCEVKFRNIIKSENEYFKTYKRSGKNEYKPTGKYRKKSGKLS